MLHVLSYKGMNIFDARYGSNLPTQLWIAARYMQSITLCIFPLAFLKRLPLRALLVSYVCVTIAITSLIFHYSIFPACYVEGVGLTPFKIYSEYIIIILLAFALLFLYRQKLDMDKVVFRCLALSIFLTMGAELAFTFYVSVYGLSNFVGHILKITSIYFIYQALIKISLTDPFDSIFREIKKSENRYRQMFETNKAVKLIIDPVSGKIVQANVAACDYYGYSQQEFASLKITDINTMLPSEVNAEMERARNKKKLTFSFQHKLADGEIRDVEVYSGPIVEKNGTFLYSIVHDVTERNRITRETEQHVTNLQAMFDSAPNLLMLLNEDIRVEMINHKGLAFLNKDKKKILGRLSGEALSCLNSFKENGCGSTPNCAFCPIRNTVASTFKTDTSHFDVEGKISLKVEGETKNIDLLISTSLLTLNNEKKVLLSLSDISLIKQKEKEIEFQAYLLNHIQDQIIATDLDGKISYVNDATCEAIQRNKQEIIGQQSIDILEEDPQRGATLKEIRYNTLHAGQWRGEIINHSNGGRETILDLRTKLIRDSVGNPYSIVSIATDITEQKIIGKQLEQAQKMEVMGTLAGGIAHDFNNILSPILGYTEILKEDTPSDNTFAMNSLDHIYTSALRASELVKQILTFARQKDTEYKPMKLQPILKEAIKLIRSTLPKNIEIFLWDIDSKCPAIHADATQMHQVIMNLMTNAYHAIDDSEGQIDVSYKHVINSPPEQLEGPHNFACLTIKDNGRGIPPDMLDRVFDPFFTTKDQGKGTGMGLSVVHGIVENMKGIIRVKSQVGKGTEFNVYLPIEPDTPIEGTAKVAPGTLPQGTEHLLLVDDEEAILEMTKQTLEKLGYKVYPMSSPLEALEAFRMGPERYDLVITDMSMPRMSGVQLTAELLNIRPNIPILLCTGFSEKLTRSSSRELGFRDLLMKPVARRELAEKIREVLEQNH